MSLKRVLICPFFGPLPEWFNKFECPKGYHIIIDTDIEDFKLRVKQKLGIDYPGVYGGSKVWDYRCALGLLYEDEIKDYNFWGHCDFDVVFGDVDKFCPDSLLSQLDVYSSHNEYVCGCFSLYRNSPEVNNLFKQYPEWKEKMIHPEPNGWVEQEYSRTLEQSGLRYMYDLSPQGNPFTSEPILEKRGNDLFQNVEGVWREVGMFHFRRSKHKGWPL